MPTAKDPLSEVDRILSEVREMLTVARDTGDINELIALQILLQLTKELHSIHDVVELITKVVDSALTFVNAERGFVMLLDDDGVPRFKLGRDKDGNYLSREDFSPSQGVIDKVLEQQQTLLVADAQSDEVLGKRKSVQDLALRTIICSPLMIKREIIGLLYVDSTVNVLGNYTRSHISVLASLSDQAAVAIRNAQKFETQS